MEIIAIYIGFGFIYAANYAIYRVDDELSETARMFTGSKPSEWLLWAVLMALMLLWPIAVLDDIGDID